MTMHPGDKVIAPLGPAYVAGFSPDGQIMVRYSRRDYPADAWRMISPKNGPCVFKLYAPDQLKEVV